LTLLCKGTLLYEKVAQITEQRKVDHIRINLEENVQFPHLTTGLERYRFMHEALPELDLNEIDTSIALFGKRLKSPILISSMTGGTELAQQINRNLAEAAQQAGIAMGLGSQRAAIEHSDLAETYRVRPIAPDICCSPMWAPCNSITATGLTSAAGPLRWSRPMRLSCIQRASGSCSAGR